jgi:anti-sigma B factor antagonist
VTDRDPQIDIEVEPDLEGRVVVVVRGALDLLEAAELRTILNRVCVSDCPDVVLDLSDVTFVGSSGLGVMIEAQQMLQRNRRRLVLRGTAPAIRRAFEITHLDRLVTFEEDEVAPPANAAPATPSA